MLTNVSLLRIQCKHVGMYPQASFRLVFSTCVLYDITEVLPL